MAIAPITVNDLTTGAINGTGVFDKLMATGAAQIESQFAKNRLQGADYAQVYLGMLQGVLNTSLQFLVNRDKISLEADLLAAQIANENQQLLLLIAQTASAEANTKMINAQTCKLKAEYDLTITTNTKTGKEADLLAQKIVTEKAQVLELGVDDNSLIGRQKALYAAQTAGFKSDKIQKGTKLMIDSWQARRMTDDGIVADDTNKLADSYIGQAVTTLLTDMGA